MSRILFLAVEDWVFASHFLPMARAARAEGLEPVVATRVARHREILESEGCRVIPLQIEREKLGLLAVLAELVRLYRVIRDERPKMVHCISLRMIMLGGLAAKVARARSILAVIGLGHLWVNDRAVNRIMRVVVRVAFRLLADRKTLLVFENHDDPREFGIDADANNVTIVPGAGVPVKAFAPSAEPAPPVKFAVLSRMLHTKGIVEAISAARMARAAGAAVELHLFGAPDPANRDSCTASELGELCREPGVVWHGPTNDVAQVWRDHHAAILLSYREGLPRMLVEAAAAGRPIVATDVPGCREFVRDNIEGLLVPAKDAKAAASALVRLAADKELREQLGAAARRRFLEGFTEEAVVNTMRGVYSRALRPAR
jgi:glycosyltransferase involved in cell wall biosynthesis